MLLVYAGSEEDLISEKEHQRSLLKGGEGWRGGGGVAQSARVDFLYS